MTLKIVDLSNNNNSKKIKDYPADGYMFKATEGNYFTDKYCDQFVQQAIKAGKVWGVYHFMDGSPWQAQADHFIAATKGYVGKGVLCLDYEMYGRQGSDIAKKWLDYVYKKTGVKPLIYMSESVTKEENWSAVVAADYGLWVAKYSSAKPNVGYWKFYAMWQYTSTPYDKNTFYGDAKAWKAYAKGNTSGSNQKPPTPEPGPDTSTLEGMATKAQNGGYGNGSQRETNLGKYFKGVQAIINQRAGISSASAVVNLLANEVVAGKYGNGDARKKLLGSYYGAVQKRVNQIL